MNKLNKKFAARPIIWNKENRLNFYKKCKFKNTYENFILTIIMDLII